MRLRQRGLGLRIYVRATIATRDDLIATFECECGIWCGNGLCNALAALMLECERDRVETFPPDELN